MEYTRDRKERSPSPIISSGECVSEVVEGEKFAPIDKEHKGVEEEEEERDRTTTIQDVSVECFKSDSVGMIQMTIRMRLMFAALQRYPCISVPKEIVTGRELNAAVQQQLTDQEAVIYQELPVFVFNTTHGNMLSWHEEWKRAVDDSSIRQLAVVMYQCFHALSVLAEHHIIHRNIHPANFEVMPDAKFPLVSLAGFEHACLHSQYCGSESDRISMDSFCYQAPEIIHQYMSATYFHDKRTQLPLTTKSDVWSVGMIFLRFLTGQVQDDPKLETAEKSYANILKIIENGNALCPEQQGDVQNAFIESGHSMKAANLALDLLNKTLTINPHERISAWEAMQHPFFGTVIRKERKLLRNTFQHIESKEPDKHMDSFVKYEFGEVEKHRSTFLYRTMELVKTYLLDDPLPSVAELCMCTHIYDSLLKSTDAIKEMKATSLAASVFTIVSALCHDIQSTKMKALLLNHIKGVHQVLNLLHKFNINAVNGSVVQHVYKIIDEKNEDSSKRSRQILLILFLFSSAADGRVIRFSTPAKMAHACLYLAGFHIRDICPLTREYTVRATESVMRGLIPRRIDKSWNEGLKRVMDQAIQDTRQNPLDFPHEIVKLFDHKQMVKQRKGRTDSV